MPIGMYRLDTDADVIDTTGHQLTTTKKWRDVLRNGRAAVASTTCVRRSGPAASRSAAGPRR
jgi:hypothetical protein